jgi:type VI secretion system secreted protein Hcp
MSAQLYLQLKATHQGEIKGSVKQKGHENQIEVFATEHEVESATDNTGIRRGRNVYKPFIVTKGIDKATVLLYKAWSTNELFATFKLDYFKKNVNGQHALFYTVELSGACIVSIKQSMASAGYTDAEEREIIAFTYRTITWTFADGNLTAEGNTTSRT